MVERTTEMYGKTYRLYVSVQGSSQFFCTFLVQAQVYDIFLEHIGDFFRGLCRGIERSNFLSDQICGAGTTHHYDLNAVDPMPGISIQSKWLLLYLDCLGLVCCQMTSCI